MELTKTNIIHFKILIFQVMGFSIKLLEENLKNSKISPPSLPSFIIVVRELDVDNCHYKTEIVM